MTLAQSHWQDGVNAVLEMMAVAAVGASISKALKDRDFKGFSAFHMAYSVTSATWFVYYYHWLAQPFSLAAAFGYWVAVASWAIIMIRLRPRGKP